jgi:FKBP-type peptidyl-prolyl cis-trans isomerase
MTLTIHAACLLAAATLAMTTLANPSQEGAAAQDPPATQPATQPATTPAQPPADPPPQTPPAAEEYQTTEGGVRYRVVEAAGEPMTAQAGDVVMTHYTGKFENGQVFDTSLRPTTVGRFTFVRPFVFKLGEGQVIKGWDEGIAGMKVGEKRTMVIPPELAYGKTGAGGGVIPPDATLVFDVHLLGVWRPDPAAAPESQPAQP